MSDKFTELDQTLDRESFDWLCDNHPQIAQSLQTAMDHGATPTEIRARILERAGLHRRELAARCESAARHVSATRYVKAKNA